MITETEIRAELDRLLAMPSLQFDGQFDDAVKLALISLSAGSPAETEIRDELNRLQGMGSLRFSGQFDSATELAIQSLVATGGSPIYFRGELGSDQAFSTGSTTVVNLSAVTDTASQFNDSTKAYNISADTKWRWGALVRTQMQLTTGGFVNLSAAVRVNGTAVTFGQCSYHTDTGFHPQAFSGSLDVDDWNISDQIDLVVTLNASSGAVISGPVIRAGTQLTLIQV